jgi:hypothetical protein
VRGGPRAVLMSLRLETEARGFHILNFKVTGVAEDVLSVEVMISRDAQRKLVGQFRSNRVRPIPDRTLVTEWAVWVVNERLRQRGTVPATLAVVAGDVDEYGAYAQALLREIGIAA